MKRIEIDDWRKNPAVKQLVNGILPSYRRKKVTLVLDTSVTLHQLGWDDGAKNEYFFGGLTGGVLQCWDEYGEGKKVSVPPGRVVLEGGIFRSKQSLLRIHVNPADVTTLLPDYKAEGYYVEHNGDCWQSVFPTAQSHLSQLHTTTEDALDYMHNECGVADDITVLPRK